MVRLLGVVAATAVLGTTAAGAAARRPRPDLIVSAISTRTRSAAPGGTVAVTVTTKDRGPARARASTTTLLLSRDARRDRTDVRLGRVKVPKLRPRGTKRGLVTVRVPARTPAGVYRLLACADGAGTNLEASERNNCRVAPGRLAVKALPVFPASGPATPFPVAPVVPAPTPDPVSTTPTTGTTPTTPGDVDTDGDGTVDRLDCAPLDPAIVPGKPDLPDLPAMVDSNCDGIDGDAAKAIFVAPTGVDTAPGTREAPKKTLNAAAAAAATAGAGTGVLAQVGSYPEVLTVRSGVSVYGGYGSDWSRSATVRSAVGDAGSSGGTANGIHTPTTLQALSLTGRSGFDFSSYGMRVDDSPALRLDHLTLVAGNGLAGTRGADGADGRDGTDGTDGKPGSCDGDSPGQSVSGGASPVPGHQGGAGGMGGIPAVIGTQNGFDGGAGGPLGIGGAGGAGGASGDPGRGGKRGEDGVNGANGADGAGEVSGTAAFGSWAEGTGGNGTKGVDGGGGGGGGGSGAQTGATVDDGGGNGGGGGGGGGEGGQGGQGGRGGGGSFGLLVTRSSGLVLQDSTLTAANGGKGGTGGDRGDFGASGGVGFGGDGCSDHSQLEPGGRGGFGGFGGAGGWGGGGAGGPSVAFYHAGVAVTQARNTFSFGQSGAGGYGAVHPGTAGVASPEIG